MFLQTNSKYSISKKDIIEGNKIIVNSIGYNYYPFNDSNIFNSKIESGYYKNINELRFDKQPLFESNYLCRSNKGLKFNCDWNWIMKIIEKIEILDNNIRFEITNNSVTSYFRFDNELISYYEITNSELTKIEAVFLTVVDIIHYFYSSNKINDFKLLFKNNFTKFTDIKLPNII